jgi:hypothetical protein
MTPKDDPAEIADFLIQEHGIVKAIEEASQEAVATQNRGDYYDLSIWREVRQNLRDRRDS